MLNSGWMCPGCGKCYSPTTPQCFSCGNTTLGTNTKFDVDKDAADIEILVRGPKVSFGRIDDPKAK